MADTNNNTPAGKPSSGDIADQLIECMHEITGFDEGDIAPEDSLEEKFKFDKAGKRDLAKHLTDCFAKHGMPIPKPLTRDATGKAKTIEDLFQTILKLFK